jgi:hypothetical protein
MATAQLLYARGTLLAPQTDLLQSCKSAILELDDVVESLEHSHTSVTNAVIHTTDHKVISDAKQPVKVKRIYISCSKGALIKMAIFWCIVWPSALLLEADCQAEEP